MTENGNGHHGEHTSAARRSRRNPATHSVTDDDDDRTAAAHDDDDDDDPAAQPNRRQRGKPHEQENSMALTEAQEDAVGLVDDLVELAAHSNWTVHKRGVNKTHAWGRLTHPWKLDIQAFYAVDEETHKDQFLFGDKVIPQAALRALVEGENEADLAPVFARLGMNGKEIDEINQLMNDRLLDYLTESGPAVPPTSAAHSAAHQAGVPPTVDEAERAAHTLATNAQLREHQKKMRVPPTGVEGAAHLGPDGNFDVPPMEQAAIRAAHMAEDVPPTSAFTELFNAAHPEIAVPPTYKPGDPPGEYRIDADSELAQQIRRQNSERVLNLPPIEDADLNADDRLFIAQEAQAHLAQAGAAAGGPASQQDTYAAVEAQQRMGGKRNWSAVASPLSTDELLAKVPGKTIRFRNRLSGRTEEATVCTAKEARNHVPKITPFGFDPEAEPEDMRILHFLELGAGFRSIAVSQILEIN